MDSDGKGASPFGPRGSTYRWFQFGVPDLLLLVVAVAVAASLWTAEDIGWDQALLTGISVFFIAGLLLQIRDLWATFSGRTDLSADQRWGWRACTNFCVTRAGYVIC